jgi:hypothetical protein
MTSPNDLTALSYRIDPIGKLFSDSKTRHTWTMDVQGDTQVVMVTASWNSGKFVVEVNGYERFHQVVNEAFAYSFRFKDRFFKVQQVGDQLVLSIDSIPFAQYTAQAKEAQAMLLQSYEKRAKERTVSRSISSEAFSGDLAKRLGKKTPEEYVEQRDDEGEDYFSAPVNIESFVKPPQVADLTVIPDLIEFSSEVSATSDEKKEGEITKASTPEESGQVTPRDQISPSKLQNPFSAFDELNPSNVDNPFR